VKYVVVKDGLYIYTPGRPPEWSRRNPHQRTSPVWTEEIDRAHKWGTEATAAKHAAKVDGATVVLVNDPSTDYARSGFPHELYVEDVFHKLNFETSTVIKCGGCSEVAVIPDRVLTSDLAYLEKFHKEIKGR
jgi:hypothetical protein